MQVNSMSFIKGYSVSDNKKSSGQIGFNGKVDLKIPRILQNDKALCKEARDLFKTVQGSLENKANLNNLDILFNLCVDTKNKVGLFCTVKEHKGVSGNISELISKISGNVTVPFNKDPDIFIKSSTEAIDRFYNPALYK